MIPENGINPADHDKLVMAIAFKWGARQPVKDSWQYAEGWLGLIRAAECFDPSKGFQFSTYASYWIASKIQRVYTQAKEPKRAGDRRVIQEAALGGHRDEPLPLADLAVDPAPAVPDQAHERHEAEVARLLVNDLLRHLDERTARMVRAHVCDGMTLEAIGSIEGRTKERIRQIVAKGMDRIKAHARRRGMTCP